MTISIDLYQS